MEAIFNRRSIRRYKDTVVNEEAVLALLKAGMAAPSAGNEQPWEFVVLRDREVMEKITKVHPYSKMLLQASVAIAVCGNQSKEIHEGYWVQDCSAATENILIAAQDRGLGAVWLGVFPVAERVEAIKRILNLPESVIPLSIISLGYPDEQKKPVNRFDITRIHYDRW